MKRYPERWNQWMPEEIAVSLHSLLETLHEP